jgi:predicted ATPase
VFSTTTKTRYDIVILSDIIEHVENESEFLENVSFNCKYALLKIPIEECLTNKDWYYKLRGKTKTEAHHYGAHHYNGHLRGYTIRSALKSVSRYFFILDTQVSDVVYFYSSASQKKIRPRVGSLITTWLLGGALFILAESKHNNR